jgi:predicted dehydrogenase
MDHATHRRDFAKSGLATAAGIVTATTAKARGPLGANERVRIGCIGVGNRGCQVLEAFVAHSDAEVIALCDVYEPYLNGTYDKIDNRFKPLGPRVPQRQPEWERQPERYKDFRRILDRKDIDAVIVATPDHWHAIQTIQACEAGKDVYCEKPLSVAVAEGRRMVQAARRTDRVVQVGLHRRSSKVYAQLAEVVKSGQLGKVTICRSNHASNMFPNGIGNVPDSEPPAGLDWDMWLGPRPARPFNENILPYKFRWWHLYSSQMANWGVHYFDVMRWVTGEAAPASLSAHGGAFALHDSRTIPDTAEVIFEHASGMLMTFGVYEASGNPVLRAGEVEIRGTLGTAVVGPSGFEILPERGGQFQDPGPKRKPQNIKTGDNENELAKQHARNFLDCIKSRQQPNADIEDGHRSTTFALLANIALATKSRLEWDAQAERIINNDKANELLDYAYRKPWTHA